MSRYRSFNEFKDSYATIHLNYDDTIDIIFGGDKHHSLKLSSMEALSFGQSLIGTAIYEMTDKLKKDVKDEKDDS